MCIGENHGTVLELEIRSEMALVWTVLYYKHDVEVKEQQQQNGQFSKRQYCSVYCNYIYSIATGNLHKWLFCPRGCALIWSNPCRQHDWFRPLVTSAFEYYGLKRAFACEGE